ncbi:hypothetical protein NKR19_g6104 [Coniochaeta hoffmannii]|uniref:Stress-response A/B barrel domain-containing protein n=1 Tax=Coniochaeta hoffmannii TaxID=91930 RepID=A0AA38RFS8_9PEZI|nr:hypothetical protein NKR19_g6104 [Coniochaeta hoffmannii]
MYVFPVYLFFLADRDSSPTVSNPKMGSPFSNKIAEILCSKEQYPPPQEQPLPPDPRMASTSTPSAAARVLRTTMFRISDPANQQKLIQAYNKLAAEQKKDGKPYILYMAAGISLDPARSRGYTVVSRSEFASMEDMRWYDEQCPAHAALKEAARGFGMPEPPLVIYHEDVPLVNQR